MVLALNLIFGKVPRRSELVEYVLKTAREKNLHLDRASARLKEGLICWLCENCPNILAKSPTPPVASVPITDASAPFDPTDDDEDSAFDKFSFY
jgi:hypothetical protein